MLLTRDDSHVCKINYAASDPVVIFDSRMRVIPLDEEHPEHVLGEGEMAVFSYMEKYKYSFGIAKIVEGELYMFAVDTVTTALAELIEETKQGYEFELVERGRSVEGLIFETKEDAQDFIDANGMQDQISIRMVRKEDWL